MRVEGLYLNRTGFTRLVSSMCVDESYAHRRVHSANGFSSHPRVGVWATTGYVQHDPSGAVADQGLHDGGWAGAGYNQSNQARLARIPLVLHDRGPLRFDGYKFTNYTSDDGLPSALVLDFVETRGGAYWVATHSGLCRFNPRGSRAAKANPMFTVYLPGEDAASSEVLTLLEDRSGRVWLGTPGGLYWLEESGERVIFHLTDLGEGNERHVQALAEDQRGSLWIGGSGGRRLYRRLPQGRIERYTEQNGLDGDVKSLLADRDGHVWVGTAVSLSLVVPEPDPARPVFASRYKARDRLGGGWVFSLFQSSDGRLRAGTAALNEIVPAAGSSEIAFRSYTRAQGLSGVEMWCLAEDGEGDLWIGTKAGGAIRLARSGFTTFGASDGLGEAGSVPSLRLSRARSACGAPRTARLYWAMFC